MNDDIELRSEQIQELLNAVPNWMIRYGNMLILILIILFISLSWFIQYPDIIIAEAQITTKLPPQKIYASTSGKLDSIFISDSDSVSKNKILSVIENTANFEHVKLLKSVLDTIKTNNKDFEFPIDKLPILFLGSIDTEYAIFENNYLAYQLNKELEPYANEKNANSILKSELYSRLNILKSQKKINSTELEYQKKDLERHRKLHSKGVIASQTLEAKELSYLQAKRNHTNIDVSVAQLREAIGSANTNALNTSIKNTREEISLLKNTIQSFNQLKRSLQNWELKYTNSTDTCGEVIFSKSWTKNQNIKQGELLFTIIPRNNSSFIAKLKTPAQNFGKIKSGQTVRIKLENYPETEFGTINGKIQTLSMLPDENGLYNVTVLLPKKLKTSYNREINFRYEMRGSAEIITEDLKLIDRFFYQLKNIFKS